MAEGRGWDSRSSQMLKFLLFLCSEDAAMCVGLSIGFSHPQKNNRSPNLRARRVVKVQPFVERIDYFLEFQADKGRP